MLALISGLSVACEPYLRIEVTNNTDEPLFIYAVITPSKRSVTVGSVTPGSTINKSLGVPIVNALGLIVTAKNEKGNVIFSRTYSREEYSDTYVKVTISLP